MPNQPSPPRRLGGLFAGFAMLLSAGAVSAGQMVEILSTPGCGCCVAWQRHLEESGFRTGLRKLPMTALQDHKARLGLAGHLTSCHTGMVGGYVIEGHVPAREITRLLSERPDAIGLTVPGMPHGSPGMGPPEQADPYDVLLLGRDGAVTVYASYRNGVPQP